MKIDVPSASGPAERVPDTMPSSTAVPAPVTPTDNPKTSAGEPFRTPEQVAAADDLATTTTMPNTPGKEPTATTKSWRSRLALQWPPRRKEYLVAIATIIILGGGVVAGLALTRSDPPTPVAKPKAVAVVKTPPPPTTVASTLSGLQVDPSINQRPVTAVMIENSLDARPQSGLSEAGVVFEA
ncbi:MAG: DUF3048 domain-containing protein, partial [Candidatus Saccharimonadales bacterium]